MRLSSANLNIDIHFKFMEGNLADLTFTMAWIKFRFFEPISHTDCSIDIETQVSPPVRWALEAVLKQKDIRAGLSKEQLESLLHAAEIANDVFEASTFPGGFEVATRLAYGTVRAPPTPSAAQGGLVHTLFGPTAPTTQPHTQSQMLLNQLHASFNNFRMPPPGTFNHNHPSATFGGPLMANPFPSIRTAPSPFGPSHVASLHRFFGNGPPAPGGPGNGPGQSMPAPFGNRPPGTGLSGNGPGQSTLVSFGTGPSSSLFGNGPGHPSSNPFSNRPPPFPPLQLLPLLHQLPSFHNNPPPHIQNAPTIPGPAPAPAPPARIRRYRSWELQEQLRNSLTETEAANILIKDNEMRVLAALDLHGEMQELSIKRCAVLRAYFALMEMAGKMTALKQCLEEAI